MPFCEQCASEISATVKFCTRCGAPVAALPPASSGPDSTTTQIDDPAPAAQPPQWMSGANDLRVELSGAEPAPWVRPAPPPQQSQPPQPAPPIQPTLPVQPMRPIPATRTVPSAWSASAAQTTPWAGPEPLVVGTGGASPHARAVRGTTSDAKPSRVPVLWVLAAGALLIAAGLALTAITRVTKNLITGVQTISNVYQTLGLVLIGAGVLISLVVLLVYAVLRARRSAVKTISA